MFKNLYLFRLLPEWKLNGEQLRQRLQSHALDESQTLSMQQLGWVPPRKGGDLCIVTEGGQCLFALRVQKRLLPATVVKQVAAVRIDELEERQGFRPGKKMRKEITERVHDELLPKAFIVYRDTQVWVDLKNRWLVIDTATASKADEVIGALAKAIDPIHIESLLVQQSSAACMTNWLLDDEAPNNFTIDQDAELRAGGQSKARIRWVKTSIDAEDARRHISDGKQCTRLAMTWKDRISFVSTESLTLRSVAPLNVLKEDVGPAKDEDERFHSDFALMSGEFAQLLADLVDAHGGFRRALEHAESSAPAELSA
ncbi:recombination-associated protein RdgC (plasmid) [Achromobacter xylosoxidans]|uniref:recombination-associated protein RdgC n=1 Tax=Alcaligenes xylosoxydans xylosoxydans TaxID=85698 RepID=UPI000DD104F2|nr:recombination-associated protein RdgC [Achromobacter xylosoxidans]AXA80602.1 recombination-associated protein RdgC [Achromobacter xylosoxidans]